MKKVILTTIIGLLNLMSFGQRGTTNHPNFAFPIDYDLGELIYNSSYWSLYSNSSSYLLIEEAKQWDLGREDDILENKGLTSINGVQYFKEGQELYLDGNPLEEYGMLDSMNIDKLYLEGTGITHLSLSNKVQILKVANNPDLDSICVANDKVIDFLITKDDHTKVYDKSEAILSFSNQVSVSNELSLFPNPVQNVLSFNGDVSSVSVYSVDGVEVFTSSEVVNNTVDLSSLPQGKYLIKFITDDKVISKMIIKE